MATLLLHIGSPKTGSTAIQASLYSTASALRAQTKILFLPPNPFRKPFPSGFLSACFLTPDLLPRILAARHLSDQNQFNKDVISYRFLLSDLVRLGKPASTVHWKALLQRHWADFRHRPTRSAIASSEYLFRFPAESIYQLKDWFVSLGFTTFKILVYIREPVSAYKSFLQQWLRMSDDLSPYNPFEWLYEIRSSIESWESVFGREAMIVRPFQASQLYNQSVVADFYRIASSVFGHQLEGPESPNINESLSVEALWVMQELLSTVPPERRSTSEWMSLVSKFLRLLRQQQTRLSCSPVDIHPWVAETIWARHREDYQWFASRYDATFEPPSTSSEVASFRKRPSDSLCLSDLIVPPPSLALVEQMKQVQLAAIFNSGLK